MELKHITITGDLGSGKSTVARNFEEKYGAKRVSTGEVQRQLAEDLGIDTLEMNKRAETDPSIDEKIDSIFKSLNNSKDVLVVDSRMAWHFMPSSFKICMKVDLDVAAKRVWDNDRKGERYDSFEECKNALRNRRDSERARFLKTYNVDLTDPDNFNLVIDTSNTIASEVAEQVLQAYEEYCS